MVNRFWGYLMGRGLVEPIDDLRATNPPSNPDCSTRWPQDFVKQRLRPEAAAADDPDARGCTSSTRSRRKANAADTRFYSHYRSSGSPAEQLLDAVDAGTGTQTKFERLPLGTRAIELPDARYSNYFLNTFGQPRRGGVCECERVSEPNLAQALHMLNGDLIEQDRRQRPAGWPRSLKAKKPRDEIVDRAVPGDGVAPADGGRAVGVQGPDDRGRDGVLPGPAVDAAEHEGVSVRALNAL